MLTSLSERLKALVRRLDPSTRDRLQRGYLALNGLIRAPATRQRLATDAVALAPGGAPITLVFAPEAGVRPHFAAVCLVARTLQERGHRVLITRCFELLPRCPVMDMFAHPVDTSGLVKSGTCITCAHQSLAMTGAYGLSAVDLRTAATPEVRAKVRAAMDRLPADLQSFEHEGILFGKLSGHDVTLMRKVSTLESVSPEVRTIWERYLESCVLAYELVGAMCRTLPVERLVYFADYGLMLSTRHAAHRAGIPAFTLNLASHMGNDRRRVLVSRDILFTEMARRAEAWGRWRDLALPPAVVEEVASDALVRFGGASSHVYSPPMGSAPATIAVEAPARKLLVAFTSSLDEVTATSFALAGMGKPEPLLPQPFPDQIAWLDALARFVSSRPDLELAVRVHPREGANKREATSSQHLARLREAFGTPRERVRFVWPGEAVSSYDLGLQADMVLISWSTMGLEFARLGAPVLAMTIGRNPYPIGDFIFFEETSDAYFRTLVRLLDAPPTLDVVKYAYRWYHLYWLGQTLDFSDLIPARDFEGLPPWRMPRAADALEQVVVGGGDLIEINRAQLVARQSPDASSQEEAALKRQLRRVLHFLYTGRDRTTDAPLIVGREDRGGGPSDVLVVNGARTRYISGGRTWDRASPVCARLATLCASEDHD